MRVALGLVLLAGCGPTVENAAVEAEQRDGVWVFRYAERPSYVMDALGGGPATVDGDCLFVGDAVVIWWEEYLPVVDEVIARVQDGEALEVRLGGGGLSLDEGATTDDFPPSVLQRCSPTAVWHAGDMTPEIVEGS